MPFDSHSSNFSPRVRPPGPGGWWSIRPLADRDHAALLRLNAANYPAVSTLTPDELAWLLSFDGLHRVAVDDRDDVIGYLLSFPRPSVYDDEEVAFLRSILPGPFWYIAQVVLAPAQRGRGLGRQLYRVVFDEARRRGIKRVCSDVNLDPPNPESMAFHRSLGFVPVAEKKTTRGPLVAFMELKLT